MKMDNCEQFISFMMIYVIWTFDLLTHQGVNCCFAQNMGMYYVLLLYD